MIAPPDYAIAAAEAAARDSPCAKSRRGAAVFFRGGAPRVQAVGFNRPPPGVLCDGSEACRRSCGKRCLHAEHLAIRDLHEKTIARPLLASWELVHVKIGPDGKVVPGGGPSCWQCSREILDVGIGAVWLFEYGTPNVTDQTEPPPAWVRYDARTFHVETCRNAEVY